MVDSVNPLLLSTKPEHLQHQAPLSLCTWGPRGWSGFCFLCLKTWREKGSVTTRPPALAPFCGQSLPWFPSACSFLSVSLWVPDSLFSRLRLLLFCLHSCRHFHSVWNSRSAFVFQALAMLFPVRQPPLFLQ